MGVDAVQHEYFGQLMIDANILPLLLKLFSHHEASDWATQDNELVQFTHGFLHCASLG
jgi:hypothetical protein